MEEGLSYRRSIWASSLITLVGLIIFIGIAAVIPTPSSNAGLLALGVLLALIPALIWLSFFYQQDRTEPEPERLVLRMFVFGALAALAFVPVGQQMEQVLNQYSNPFIRLPLTIVSLSLMQETIKVGMVRYVLLGTNEFDEYPDGIVYGLASGLGLATVLTVATIVKASGMIPLAGASIAVNNALVHGVLGAVTGYYLGRVKLDGKKLPWMMRGLAIAAVVNGMYTVLSSELSNRLAFNPWYSLGAAVILAAVVGVVLFSFFRRALRRATGDLSTVSIQAHARSMDMPWDIHPRYDYLLIGALVLALASGLGANQLLRTQTLRYQSDALPVAFTYPKGWAIHSESPGEFSLRDLSSSNTFKTTISVVSNKTRGGTPLDLLTAQQITADSRFKVMYTELGTQQATTVDGNPAISVEYQYVTQTPSGPAVARGIVTYTLVEGRLFVFRYEADPLNFPDGLNAYQRLLNSTTFGSGS